MVIKIGQMVKVKLADGNCHVGEYLGTSLMGEKVGVIETSVKGVSLKPGKKYISVFYTKMNKMEVI